MAFISQEEINTIRANADIVEIISSYIPLTQKGKNYFGVCPFHDDHSPSMSVSSTKQIFKCFSCGATGNVFTFVQNYENVSFTESIALVARKIGMNIDYKVPQKENVKFKKEYEIMNLSAMYYANNLASSFGKTAKKYLQERKISEETIKEFGIGLSLDEPDALTNLLIKKGYDPETLNKIGLTNVSSDGGFYDVFWGRLLFPLWDIEGRIVGYSGRIYRGEKTSKYVNTKETMLFKKGQTLYNYHRAKDPAKKEHAILVVEGQMDAIRLSSCQIKNVVALMGSAMTKEQLELLKKLRVPVILCLDNDDAGLNAMIHIGEALEKELISVSIIKLNQAKDPDEYIIKNGVEAFQEALAHPLKYFEFKMNYLKQDKNLDSAEDLADYINSLLKELAKESDEILKEVTLTKLAKEYNLSIDVLKEKLNSLDIEKPIRKEPPKAIAKKLKPVKRRYEIAAEKVLYFMMSDLQYIKIYQKQLGFFPEQIHREMAGEIVFYYEKNKTINLADFLSFEAPKEELFQLASEIINNGKEEEINETAFFEYINTIKQEMQKKKIEKIKSDLKKEMDINRKMDLLNELTELKKGSV